MLGSLHGSKQSMDQSVPRALLIALISNVCCQSAALLYKILTSSCGFAFFAVWPLPHQVSKPEGTQRANTVSWLAFLKDATTSSLLTFPLCDLLARSTWLSRSRIPVPQELCENNKCLVMLSVPNLRGNLLCNDRETDKPREAAVEAEREHNLCRVAQRWARVNRPAGPLGKVDFQVCPARVPG